MANLTLIEAINQALMQEMQNDQSVVVLGEDVGRDGGVFRATDGLWQKWPNRVMDTPLAESGIVGTSIGLAVMGMKPIAEIQFEGFSYPAFDQIMSHAGKIRNRSRGKFHVPMVVRMPYGGGIKALEHHGEAPETFFAHIPGVKVVIPSTPYDAKGLLIAAIRDPDPVIFFEPKKIYRSFREEVPDEAYTVPIGKARVARQGKDLTIITWGAMVHLALQTAEAMKDKHDIEVIDLRTIVPYDLEAILASVKKTGRCIVLHEAIKTAGFGAEIAALLMENSLLDLAAPVLRVTGYDIPYPLAKLENYYLPDQKRLAKAIEQVMEF
jgi:pyruvate dehydrogenase E1 component beta subunit